MITIGDVDEDFLFENIEIVNKFENDASKIIELFLKLNKPLWFKNKIENIVKILIESEKNEKHSSFTNNKNLNMIKKTICKLERNILKLIQNLILQELIEVESLISHFDLLT
jgi:hypothetical protein